MKNLLIYGQYENRAFRPAKLSRKTSFSYRTGKKYLTIDYSMRLEKRIAHLAILMSIISQSSLFFSNALYRLRTFHMRNTQKYASLFADSGVTRGTKYILVTGGVISGIGDCF